MSGSLITHPCHTLTRRHESDTHPGTYPCTGAAPQRRPLSPHPPDPFFTGTITTGDAVGPPMSKRLAMHNGSVRDSEVVVCHGCNQPGAGYHGSNGEWYHADCAPVGV